MTGVQTCALPIYKEQAGDKLPTVDNGSVLHTYDEHAQRNKINLLTRSYLFLHGVSHIVSFLRLMFAAVVVKLLELVLSLIKHSGRTYLLSYRTLKVE